jgi:type III restriction enzyme
MKIQFEDKQQYQLDAINSVVQIFEGEGLISNDERTMTEEDPGALALAYKIVANRSVLTDQAILNNLRRVQEDNSISQDEALAFVSYETEEEETNFTYYPNLTVEMETGTGKTYVYLRTIYELNEKYGWKKFIVVVPGVAIREGVLKNLQITHDHFQKIYRNEPISFNVYDSKKLGRLKEFAENAAIQVLSSPPKLTLQLADRS